MERDRQYFRYRAKRRSQKTARFYPQGFEQGIFGRLAVIRQHRSGFRE
jgi:hypothetical protein